MATDAEPVVVRQEDVLSGRPTFRGTRVQAEILFENLADGYSIDEIVESFPTLDREDLRVAIMEAGRMIMDAAPSVSYALDDNSDERRTLPGARVPG